MATYKYSQYLQSEQGTAFDKLHSPGTETPFSGIYRCEVCTHEAASVRGYPLPPQSHPGHPVGRPVQWRLVVFAQHNS
jgi:hypothetical protein